MRFMVLVKADKDSEAGVLPDEKLLADMGRNPSSRTQKTLLDRHKYVMVDPIKWIDEAPKWEKVWNELFLK